MRPTAKGFPEPPEVSQEEWDGFSLSADPFMSGFCLPDLWDNRNTLLMFPATQLMANTLYTHVFERRS